jgi:hypothetical protein
MNGLNYELHKCPVHGLVQFAEAIGIWLCVPCLVQKAINTGEVLKPKEMHNELESTSFLNETS